MVDRLLPYLQEPDSLNRDTAVPVALALAPDLMAENQRMRRELEKLRDDMERKSRLSSAFGSSGYVEVMVANRITGILGGQA